ncbi:hypothetical protein QMQ05_05030 [Glutamicibacter ectropisis]|uniref:MFS transporter n=1 Tax=Glutamicibacter ectropisis TaxID=3046593 RepID=A0AAU6WGS1_9MICC
MNQKLARFLSSTLARMLLVSAFVGTCLGMLATLLMFWPLAEDGHGTGPYDLALPLTYGAIAGLLMGILCGTDAYLGLWIQNINDWEPSAQSQATAAGFGSMLAALVPALLIVVAGLGEASPAAFIATALGFLALSFASGFAVVAWLNRRNSFDSVTSGYGIKG